MKDFFISYNQHDRAAAEWIAWILEDAGYATVIQAWDFKAGGNFVLDMQRAASETERTIAVLSQHSLDSGFAQAEWAAAFRQDPTGQERSLIPVRVAPCKLTGLWATIVYIDLLRDPNADPAVEADVELVDEPEAQQRILNEIAAGRRKPTEKPAFPQTRSLQPSIPKPVFPQRQVSFAKQQRLEKQQETLQQAWSLRHKKLNELRRAQVIEASAAVQFQLRQQIKSEEDAIAQLETQLADLEQQLSPAVPPPPQNMRIQAS